MMMIRFFSFLSAVLLIVSGTLNAPGQTRFIRAHLKNETYHQGKLIAVESDYFFDAETGNLVVHSMHPEEHIKISNRLGEAKIFYPASNRVSLKQNRYFSSENELIWYFLSNNYHDLGLSDEGFRVTGTHMDGNYQVVTWTAPVGMKVISRVELVFENGQPVYSAYYNTGGEIIRKIYYYQYEIYSDFMMPMKVTQISYTPDGDSIIQRNTWSSLKGSVLPDSDFYHFKIPEDAIVLP